MLHCFIRFLLNKGEQWEQTYEWVPEDVKDETALRSWTWYKTQYGWQFAGQVQHPNVGRTLLVFHRPKGKRYPKEPRP